MAEALAGLSVACNVMAVISFSREAIEIANNIRKHGSFNSDLPRNAQRILNLSQDIEKAVNNVSQSVPSSPAQTELLDIARDCKSKANGIAIELEKITKSKLGTLGKTAQTLWRKSKLEKLEAAMVHHQQVLDSRLLERLWYVPSPFKGSKAQRKVAISKVPSKSKPKSNLLGWMYAFSSS
jgi:hypothetical protein